MGKAASTMLTSMLWPFRELPVSCCCADDFGTLRKLRVAQRRKFQRSEDGSKNEKSSAAAQQLQTSTSKRDRLPKRGSILKRVFALKTQWEKLRIAV